MQWALHLVAHEVVGPAQNDGRRGACFGASGINWEDKVNTKSCLVLKKNKLQALQLLLLLFDQDELIVTHAFLGNLLGLTQHGGLERLLSLQIC